MKIVGIYPGNFQPATKAHLLAYKNLKQISGADTFVVTTDRNPTQDAPLNFGDKEQILTRHGIPASHIIKVVDWKNPEEVFRNFQEDATMAVFALNAKQADEIANRKGFYGDRKPTSSDSAPIDKNKELWFDASGKLNYFQPYKGNEQSMSPLTEHAYVMVIDDTKIDGKMISTSNIRQVLGSPTYSPKEKQKFFTFVFGWFDLGLFQLVSSKFKLAYKVSDLTPNNKHSIVENLRKTIRTMVKEALSEVMNEEYGGGMNAGLMVGGTPTDGSATATTDDSSKTLTQQKSDLAKQRTDLVKQKKELEMKAKQNKQQRDSYQTTVQNYDKFQKKSDRDALDAINKQLSQPQNISPNGMN